MKFSIIIPTYNHCDDLLKPCLESIIKFTNLQNIEIIVVANGCIDNTREYITNLNNKNIKLLWFNDGIGYTKATNEGIKVSEGEYIILLNNDIVLLEQNINSWINILYKPFINDNVGVSGIHKKFSTETNYDFLLFYCVMIKKSVFNDIGLLDEIFSPGFGEDEDFCARAILKGYEIVNCDTNPTDAGHMMTGNFPIYHKGTATFHDDEHNEKYKKIVERNINILKDRYKIKYSIVIPTYNNCNNLLKPCLESIKNTTNLSDVEIIIVANGCVDNTKEYVESLGYPFKLLFYKEQLGYTKATNIGLKEAKGEYIVLLNNDVIIQPNEKGWLNILREPFEKYDKVGMTGPMLFKGVEGQSNDFIMFFCAMTTRNLIDDIGYLDEIFSPGGVEDVDYGLRMIIAGYKLIEVPENGPINKTHGISSGVFPIYHPGGSTVTKEKGWNDILIRNNDILKKKFPKYFHGLDWIEKMVKRKIYDCFPFYNELDLLELRFEELWNTVDYFVISEANQTYQGDYKPYYFLENKERFEKYMDKIIYIKVDDFPEFDKEDNKQHWSRNQWQKHALIQGLKNCNLDDIVIISDVDEIINPQAIESYTGGIMSLSQKMYYYDFHHLTNIPWSKAKIMQYKDILEYKDKDFSSYEITAKPKNSTDGTFFIFSSYLRSKDYYPVIENAGWHFSYMSDIEGIIKKIKSFTHIEFNKYPYTDKNYIENCIKDNINIFDNNNVFKYVEIDDTYPKYVLNNIEKYKSLGYIKSVKIDQKTLHQKMKDADNATYEEIFEINVNRIKKEEVENKIVIDVGGNKGYFSIQCMELGAKETYCFEPVKSIYNKLIEFTKNYDNINIYNLAILDGSVDEVKMDDHGAGSNMWQTNNDFEPTKCISLEQALKYVKSDGEMILKLDCEGSEFEILLNTPKEIFEKFTHMYIEIHDEMNPNYINKRQLLLDRIKSLGFDLVETGPQSGTWFQDGTFVPSSVLVYKFKKSIEKFTIGYINHNEEIHKEYLGKSLSMLDKTEYDLIITSDVNCPAKNYNKIIEKSENNYILLIHQDVSFPPTFLKNIKDTIKKYPNFGVLGIVGFDDFKNENRLTIQSSKNQVNKVDFFDSFCIVINKKNNIKFDEKTFDELHLYVEDYCMQAKNKGLENLTILIDSTDIVHYGATYIKYNQMWGRYNEYYQKFIIKWTDYSDLLKKLQLDDHFIYNEIFLRNSYICTDEELKDSVIIDIGANKGYFSIYAIMHGAKEVYAYEPNKENYKKLCENIKSFKNIIPFNIAIHHPDTKRVYSVGYDGNSMVVAGENDNSVECKSLEQIINSISSDKILLKIDTEGSEYDIILPCPIRCLNKIKVIYSEFHNEINSNPQYNINMLNKHIENLGFKKTKSDFVMFYGRQYDDGTFIPEIIMDNTEIAKFTKNEPKVYDCFPFFNEFELLEIRLEELYDVVDKFIITEGNLTHSGKPKPLYLFENMKNFEKYKDKIIIHEVDLTMDNDDWGRERHQRNGAIDILKEIAKEDDYIIVSDADEIPKASSILKHIYSNIDIIGILEQNRYMYYLNYINVSTDEPQLNSKIAKYKELQNGDICKIRYCDKIQGMNYYMIEDGGWHFTFMGGLEKVIEKVKSFAHQEYNTPEKINYNRMLSLFEEGKDVYSAKTTWKLIEIDDSFPDFVKENQQRYIKTGWIKENQQNMKKKYEIPSFEKWEENKNIKITATISTRNRYFTTLPLCLTAIANQTIVPNQLIIYDDGEHIDLREEPVYQNIFSLFQKKDIDWCVNFTDGQGQIKNHQRALTDAKHDFIWRLDDDNVPESNVLEELIKNMTNDVGAVGGLVLDPKNLELYNQSASSKIEDIFIGLNEQWFKDLTFVKEVDHLYSTFLYRKEAGKHGYEQSLSRVGFREETMFTYEMKRSGWKVLITPNCTTWHYHNPTGGIRDNTVADMWNHDEQIFLKKLKDWHIRTNRNFLVVLNNGLGDHYMFKMMLPELKLRNEKIIIATCYPEVFEDEKDIKIISIANAIAMNNGNIDKYDIYKWMVDHDWKGNVVDAFRRMYI